MYVSKEDMVGGWPTAFLVPAVFSVIRLASYISPKDEWYCRDLTRCTRYSSKDMILVG
jgi:hypothetical protein